MDRTQSAIRIDGLIELQQSLKAIDGQSQKLLRLVFNDAVRVIVSDAKANVPHKTGKAASSIKAISGQREGIVRAGGNRAPYFGFLDFGNIPSYHHGVGRKDSIERKFIRSGRYIYSAYEKHHDEVVKEIHAGLAKVIKAAGLETG